MDTGNCKDFVWLVFMALKHRGEKRLPIDCIHGCGTHRYGESTLTVPLKTDGRCRVSANRSEGGLGPGRGSEGSFGDAFLVLLYSAGDGMG